jgi:hypothetical protein
MLNPDFAARLKKVFAAQDEGAAFLRFGRLSLAGLLGVLRLRVHAVTSMLASRAPAVASTEIGGAHGDASSVLVDIPPRAAVFWPYNC